MNQVAASETTEQKILPMKLELSEAMKILVPQLVELHVIWDQYCELYSDAGTVGVLNRNCGLFFKVIQDVLWDRVLLGICRLLDPILAGEVKTRTSLCVRCHHLSPPKS